MLRAEQDVEIADRLGAPAQAAADLGADHLRDGRARPRGSAPPAAARGSARSDRPTFSTNAIPSRILASVLAPKPLSLAILPDFAAARRSARLSILSVFVQRLDLLGTRPGMRKSATRPGGVLAPQLVIGGQLPRRGKLHDLGVHRVADPGHLLQAGRRRSSPEIAGQVHQRLGGGVVGPAPERVFAPDLEQGPHLVDESGRSGRFPWQATSTRFRRAAEPSPATTAGFHTGSPGQSQSAPARRDWPSSIRSASTRARILRTRTALAYDHSTQ